MLAIFSIIDILCLQPVVVLYFERRRKMAISLFGTHDAEQNKDTYTPTDTDEMNSTTLETLEYRGEVGYKEDSYTEIEILNNNDCEGLVRGRFRSTIGSTLVVTPHVDAFMNNPYTLEVVGEIDNNNGISTVPISSVGIIIVKVCSDNDLNLNKDESCTYVTQR